MAFTCSICHDTCISSQESKFANVCDVCARDQWPSEYRDEDDDEEMTGGPEIKIEELDDYPKGPWDSQQHMKSEINDWLRANGLEDEIEADEL